MNAADLARSPEMARAIASAAALFRLHFPDARANLTPGATIPSPVSSQRRNRWTWPFTSPAGAPDSSAAAC